MGDAKSGPFRLSFDPQSSGWSSEWIGPHDDMKLGLQNTARYYYDPGWHEPGATLGFVFNKKAYEALPVDLQRMLD